MSEIREMQMAWSMEAGVVVLAFPSNLSSADIDDFEELIAVTVNGMRRRANSPSTETKGGEGG